MLSILGLILAAASASSAAAAEVSLCTAEGPGAGQCMNPQGIATDFETERVYVADQGNNRVDVFKANGEFIMAFGWGVATGAPELQQCGPGATPPTAICQTGSSGAGAGQLASPSRIAVDNVPGSTSLHYIYVTTADFRVQKFNADGGFELQFGSQGNGECQLSRGNDLVAVGPAGNVFIADSAGSEPNFTDRVEKFSPSGACLGETVLAKGNVVLTALAVDSNEDAYVSFERAIGELRKYDLSAPETQLCTPPGIDPGIGTNALALDGADHLFASQREPWAKGNGSGTYQVISEYEPSCKIVRRFGYGQIARNLVALAALHGPEGDLFAGEGLFGEGLGDIQYLTIPDPGPIVVAESLETNPIGNAKATVKAEINPEGQATSVHVEYVDDASFKADVEAGGDGFEGAGTKSTETKALTIPAGREFRVNGIEILVGCPVASKQLIEEGKCLNPKTVYHFRIVATNADNPSGQDEGTVVGVPFETNEPIDIQETWASEVGTDSATVNALVNPLGIPATGYFEYVDDATYQADKASGDGFQHAIKAPNPEAEPPEAEIDFGSGEAAVKRSATLFPVVAGTTYHYRLAATDALIEGFLFSEEKTFRAFEEPPPSACSANEAFRVGASGLLPDCRAYEMVSPLDKANGDIVVLTEGLTLVPATLNQSAVSGERLAYGSYRAFGNAQSAPYTSQYIATRDPSTGWASHGISPSEDELIESGATFDNEFRAFSDDLCEGWLDPVAEPILAPGAIPGGHNLYRRTDQECGGAPDYQALSTGGPADENKGYVMELQGLSADGSVAAFAVNGSLEGSGAPANPSGKVQLYAKAPEQGPRFVCVLPGGEASTTACSAGTSTLAGRFGSGRSANVTNAVSDDGKLIFWSDSNAEARIYLRENPLGGGPECAEASSPCTIAVSKAAEEEAGSSASHFWAAAADGSKAIFTTNGRLYEFDVAGGATQLIAGGVAGLVGASEDATRVYFVSSEAIAGASKNSEEDEAEAGKPNLYLHVAGPGSGSYRFIGTLSGADATPFANKGVTTAIAAEPIRHNGRVSPSGLHAAFMSSAPLTGYDNTDAKSGEADTEVFLYDADVNGGAGQLRCVSCNPSGARPAGANVAEGVPFWVAGRIPAYESTLYAPRVLAPDGSRLFFESQDPLVARDTNGRLDVYEWERPGTGSCDGADTTFSAAAGGCIELISSGQSQRDSELVDASPSGNDVFFATLAGLVSQDYGLVDIYDARVGGGFPSPPPPGPVCEGETCQSPPPAPEFPTPATATNVGPGNLAEAPPKRSSCPKGKHRVKKGGKSRCVKNQKAKKGKAKQKRANGERRAGR